MGREVDVMSFNPLARIIVDSIKLGGTVVEFGNQRYSSDNEYGSTKEYYLDNGYTDYIALDINENMGAKVCDLNEKVDLGERFDLVTNIGTGEHLFNQAIVFENAHNLCKNKGLMLHIVPMYPWYNHGFYNYNPLLFKEIAASNNYRIDLFILADRWGNEASLGYKNGEWIGAGDLFNTKNWDVLLRHLVELRSKRGEGVFICVVFGKTNDSDFVAPFQGCYENDFSDEKLREKYRG